ncbi:E3 SUMO-protein ligase ZBED1-like [Centruroides vittatus]|uniref:E3 SUMO-protein ligase ZBED1-like n=1 Tax=Centruroides vittatus TaxID=120091 RepID=UPI00350F86DE
MEEVIKSECEIIENPRSSIESNSDDPPNKRQKQVTDVQESTVEIVEQSSVANEENQNIRSSIEDTIEIKLTRKEELDFSLVHMLVTDLESFEYVERKGFRDFVKKLDSSYEIPSTIHLKYKLFPDLYNVLKLKLQSVLMEVKFVTLSADTWSKSSCECYYISITCHFIWNNRLSAAVLETKQIEELSSSKLFTAIKEVIDNWNLENKVVCIVTDNNTSFHEAVKKLGLSHITSFVHSLQLVANDCFELPSIDNLIQKCKNIVHWFSSEARFKDKIEQNPTLQETLHLISSVTSNWINVYYILKCIMYLKDNLEELSEDMPSTFTPGELSTIEGCFFCLDCIRVAISDTDHNQYSMHSLIIPTMSFVHEKLRLVENVKMKTALCELFLDRMKNSIHSKLKFYETADIPLMSSILDPRIKKHGFRLPLIAVKAENLLLQESSSAIEQVKTKVENSYQTTPIKSEDDDACNLLNFLGAHINQIYKRRTKASTITIELESYLADPIIEITSNPMDYWKENQMVFPNLYTLACKYLSIPAHSVPTERIFSDVIKKQSQKIENEDGCVDKFVFFRQNKWLKNVVI